MERNCRGGGGGNDGGETDETARGTGTAGCGIMWMEGDEGKLGKVKLLLVTS